MKYLLLTFLSLVFYGCTDNSISTVHNKTILKEKVPCMSLLVFPPSKDIENTLNKLYLFDTNCNFDLSVSYKNSIVCNSNQNSENKAFGMTKSYLRLELKKGQILLYSYYIDLNGNLEDKDIEKGFNKMNNTLSIN